MTEQHGLYTVQTWLTLAPLHRARLEWLVRQQGGDVADTLTRIIADQPLASLPEAGRPSGDIIPTRIFLSAEQRAAFERYVEERKVPLPDLLSQIVADYLESVEAPAPAPAPAPPAPDTRRRRAELSRLRARRDAAGATAPAWLHAYIAELEAELDGAR